MDGSTSFDGFRIPNVLWNKIEKILPTYPSSSKGGRPRRNLRGIVDAIFYRLRTGCQWKAIPSCFAPGSTAHQYFQEWVELGVFDAIWQLALQEYDDLIGLNWSWQSADCAMTKSPLGHEETGKNPTDRGKRGTKRSLITEATGIPVGISVGAANMHDIRLLRSTLEDCFRRVPIDEGRGVERLCLDKGYDSASIRKMIIEEFGYRAHIRSRGEEKRLLRDCRRKPRRWVVERTHSWLNRFRGILIRWDKKSTNYIANLQFACAYYTFKKIMVFG
jgi:putative transposase